MPIHTQTCILYCTHWMCQSLLHSTDKQTDMPSVEWHTHACIRVSLSAFMCVCVRYHCISKCMSKNQIFSVLLVSFHTTRALSATTFTYIFGLCVTHNVFALYTSAVDDNDNNNSSSNRSSDNNLSDDDGKKVHGFAFASNEAVSMLPPKSEMKWNGKQAAAAGGIETKPSLSIDGKEKKRKENGNFSCALLKEPNLDMYYICIMCAHSTLTHPLTHTVHTLIYLYCVCVRTHRANAKQRKREREQESKRTWFEHFAWKMLGK